MTKEEMLKALAPFISEIRDEVDVVLEQGPKKGKDVVRRFLERARKIAAGWKMGEEPLEDIQTKIAAAARKAVPEAFPGAAAPAAAAGEASLSKKLLAGMVKKKEKPVDRLESSAFPSKAEADAAEERRLEREAKGKKPPPKKKGGEGVTKGKGESPKARARRLQQRAVDESALPEFYKRQQEALRTRSVKEGQKARGKSLGMKEQARRARRERRLGEALLEREEKREGRARRHHKTERELLRREKRAAIEKGTTGVRGQMRSTKKALQKAGKGLKMGGWGPWGLSLALMLGPQALEWMKGRVDPESKPDFQSAEEMYAQLRGQDLDRRRQERMAQRDPELYQTVLNMLAGVPAMSGQLPTDIAFGASTEQASEEQVDPRLLSMLLGNMENR